MTSALPLRRRDTLLIVGSSMVPGCTSFDVTSSVHPDSAWPMFGYNAARTSYHPDSSGPTSSVDVLWKTQTGGNFLASPVVVGQTLYIGGENYLQSVNTADGAERWRLSFDGMLNTPVAYANETIFTGTTGGRVHAVDASGGTAVLGERFGAEQWTSDVRSNVLSAPAVKDGVVYTVSVSGTLTAFDGASGAIKWEYPGGGKQFSAPAVGTDRVYLNRPEQQAQLVAIDRENGEHVWSFPHGNETEATFSTPVVADGRVFLGSPDGTLYALDAMNGETQLAVDTGSTIMSPPVVTDEAVFVGNHVGQIHAVERRTGERRWTATVADGTESSIRAAPAVAGSTLYVATTSGEIHAFDTGDGTRRWRFDVRAEIYGGVVPLDSRLYVQTRSGTLYALGKSSKTSERS